jgi:hypothetical protein
VALGASATAQMPMDEMAKRVSISIAAEGKSGSRLRDNCINQLPWRQMSASGQKRVRKVLDSCAQYRRLPELHYNVRDDVYRYLVDHPDVAVSTWRVMGISKIQMWQTGSMEFEATDPDGSIGLADILYRDKTQCLMLCDGIYSSPLLPKPITAAGLVWLRHDHRPTRDNRTLVRQKLDVFISFPTMTGRAMAMLASPVTNVMMDRNAFEISLYARMMSQAAENDPVWIEELAAQMDGVLPQRRKELSALVRPVETARDRTTTVSGRTPTKLPPVRTFYASMIDVHRTVAVLTALKQALPPADGDEDPTGILNLAVPHSSRTTDLRPPVKLKQPPTDPKSVSTPKPLSVKQ